MYLAFIYIGGGSSWATDTNIKKAVETAVKIAKRDWGRFYEFDKPIPVNIFELPSDWDSWYADPFGLYVNLEGQEDPVLLERHDLVMHPTG